MKPNINSKLQHLIYGKIYGKFIDILYKFCAEVSGIGAEIMKKFTLLMLCLIIFICGFSGCKKKELVLPSEDDIYIISNSLTIRPNSNPDLKSILLTSNCLDGINKENDGSGKTLYYLQVNTDFTGEFIKYRDKMADTDKLYVFNNNDLAFDFTKKDVTDDGKIYLPKENTENVLTKLEKPSDFAGKSSSSNESSSK